MAEIQWAQLKGAPNDEGWGGQLQRFRGCAHHHQLTVQPQQRQVVRKRVIGTDGVDDAVQAPGDGLHFTSHPHIGRSNSVQCL